MISKWPGRTVFEPKTGLQATLGKGAGAELAWDRFLLLVQHTDKVLGLVEVGASAGLLEGGVKAYLAVELVGRFFRWYGENNRVTQKSEGD